MLLIHFRNGAAFSHCPSCCQPAPSIISKTALAASRRDVFLPILAATVTTALLPKVSSSDAAETIGKADDCNDSFCVGVWDGLLTDCPHDEGLRKLKSGAGCACSQDDTPGVFSEP